MDDEKTSRKIVICGGGIIGASIAYYLSLRGVGATVVERCGIACHASGKAGGFMAKDWCETSPVKHLAGISFEMHAELASTLPGDHQYRRLTTLSVKSNSSKNDSAKKRPDDVSWIGAPVQQMEVIGTTDTTAQIHPRLFTEALMKVATENGATLKMGTVNNMIFAETDDGKQCISGVMVDKELLPADVVVIAMGPWSTQAKKWFPSLPSFSGYKVHSILIRPETPVSAHALFTECRLNKDKSLAPEIYPRPDGEVYVCGAGSKTDLPEDPSQILPEKRNCNLLHEVAGYLSPNLQAAVDTEQACYVPHSVDGIPVIGKIVGCDGAYIAAGHGVWGILNAPATGLGIAELILDGVSKSVNIEPFNPDRFVDSLT